MPGWIHAAARSPPSVLGLATAASRATSGNRSAGVDSGEVGGLARADGQSFGTSGPGDPVESHVGHPLGHLLAGQRCFARHSSARIATLDPVHPAQVAVQGVAHGAALDPSSRSSP